MTYIRDIVTRLTVLSYRKRSKADGHVDGYVLDVADLPHIPYVYDVRLPWIRDTCSSIRYVNVELRSLLRYFLVENRNLLRYFIVEIRIISVLTYSSKK